MSVPIGLVVLSTMVLSERLHQNYSGSLAFDETASGPFKSLNGGGQSGAITNRTVRVDLKREGFWPIETTTVWRWDRVGGKKDSSCSLFYPNKGTRRSRGEKVVNGIRRTTCTQNLAEEKIRIVLDGLKREDSIAELLRRERIA